MLHEGKQNGEHYLRFAMFCFDLIFYSKKYALKILQKTIQMKSDVNITFCVICWRLHSEWLHNDSFYKTEPMKNFWTLHCESLHESFAHGSLSRKVYILSVLLY